MQHRHVDGYNTAIVMDRSVLTNIQNAQKVMSSFETFNSNRKNTRNKYNKTAVLFVLIRRVIKQQMICKRQVGCLMLHVYKIVYKSNYYQHIYIRLFTIQT
jgi:hypothetical protein